MKWSYKTVHFELKKEGLLGGAFLDETEIEEQLNDYGRSGWELVSVIEVQDGIIAFFKQSLNLGFGKISADQEDVETDYTDAEEQEFEPLNPHLSYTAVIQEPEQEMGAEKDEPDHHGDLSDNFHQEAEHAAQVVQQTLSPEPEEIEYPDQYQRPEQEQDQDDEPVSEPGHSGIGAIKIE